MKKMVRNEDAFTQRFRTGLESFFFRFFIWPQNQKKASPDLFLEHMVPKVYTAKISGPYRNYFIGPGACFLEVTVIYGPVNLSELLLKTSSGRKLCFLKHLNTFQVLTTPKKVAGR